MATDYTATNIGSGVAQQTTMNAEWAAIELALGRALNVYGDSTNGTNAMQVDFDMNSNDILNGGVGNFTNIIVGGIDLTAQVAAAAASAAAASSSETNAAASAAASAASAASLTGIFPTLVSTDPGNLIVVNATYDGYDIATHFDLDHTAAENSDHAIHISVDTAAYTDVKAIEVDYITGTLAAGNAAILSINIDESSATGGHVYALNISSTDGAAIVHGLRTEVNVHPIHQDSGVFINPTTATNNTQSTDVPNMLDGNSGTTTSIFVANSDYIIIGNATAFSQLEMIITTVASGAGVKPTFWYSTTGTHQFTQFFPTDGTDGFKHTGIISWQLGDLTGHVTDAVTGTYDIKIIRTQNTLLTNPTLGYAHTAATTTYDWDSSGNLTIASLTTTGNVTVAGAFTSLGIDDNATATAITIDSSNDVGINNASPAYPLDVGGSGQFAQTTVSDTYLYIGCQDNGNAILALGGEADPDAGRVAYDDTLDHLSLFTDNAEQFKLDSYSNVYLGGTPIDRATGSIGTIHIANAGTNPAANPTGGGVLYVNAGALTYRGPSGTVTTIAVA